MFDVKRVSEILPTTNALVDELLEEVIDGTNSDQDIEVVLRIAYLRIRREVCAARLHAMVRAEVRWAMRPPRDDEWRDRGSST